MMTWWEGQSTEEAEEAGEGAEEAGEYEEVGGGEEVEGAEGDHLSVCNTSVEAASDTFQLVPQPVAARLQWRQGGDGRHPGQLHGTGKQVLHPVHRRPRLHHCLLLRRGAVSPL